MFVCMYLQMCVRVLKGRGCFAAVHGAALVLRVHDQVFMSVSVDNRLIIMY